MVGLFTREILEIVPILDDTKLTKSKLSHFMNVKNIPAYLLAAKHSSLFVGCKTMLDISSPFFSFRSAQLLESLKILRRQQV